MAVVLSYWKYTILIWRFGKFTHETFNHIREVSSKNFVYIFNIKNSGFIISRQLTLETERWIFRLKDFRLFHNSSDFPMFWLSLLLKYSFFFVRISFCSSFLTSLQFPSSTYKWDFMKTLFLKFIFSIISSSNQSSDVPFMHLFLLKARLSITVLTFWMKFSWVLSMSSIHSWENLIFLSLFVSFRGIIF